jgi:hypothetical protein
VRTRIYALRSLKCLDRCAKGFAQLDGLTPMTQHLSSSNTYVLKVTLGVIVNLASKGRKNFVKGEIWLKIIFRRRSHFDLD